MTESSSWPTEHEELAKHVLDRLDEFPYPVLTDIYRESDRDQSVLRLSTYYDNELYGSELVIRDEQAIQMQNEVWKDQIDRQLRAMGEALEEAGADGHWYDWGMSPVDRELGADVDEPARSAMLTVSSRKPRVRGIDGFDCTVVNDSAESDRVRVSCTVDDREISEEVWIGDDPLAVEDGMDALEQRALGLMQKHD